MNVRRDGHLVKSVPVELGERVSLPCCTRFLPGPVQRRSGIPEDLRTARACDGHSGEDDSRNHRPTLWKRSGSFIGIIDYDDIDRHYDHHGVTPIGPPPSSSPAADSQTSGHAEARQESSACGASGQQCNLFGHAFFEHQTQAEIAERNLTEGEPHPLP